jgi:hypothetical protein
MIESSPVGSEPFGMEKSPMEYPDYVRILGSSCPELAAELAPFHGLGNVLEWMKRLGLSLDAIELVTQDEFSHDVLIPWGPSGQVVAFGVT